MTSYKICLTVFVLAGLSVTANCLYNPSNHRRIRRDNTEDGQPSGPASDTSDDHGYQGGYRFGDEYFLPEASKSVPTEYNGKTNGCERVTKDSMVCMVCKDPKTNEKYEQCSYVAQPNEKAFTFAKSRSFGNPEKTKKSTKNYNESESPESSGENYESSEAPHKNYEKYVSSEPSYNYEAESRSPSRYSESSDEESESFREPAESSDCRRVKKDGETCTICKDPDTGRDVEKCSSNYQPDEKAFSTGKFEKYSYPESQEEKDDYNSYKGGSSSESSEDPAESSNCRQVQKDGQTCSICKDPKTGSDLERCSSSYQPDDKSYAYGRSERYGYPHSHDNYESPNDDDKSEETTSSYESSPSEFQADYLKANDDNYRKYHESEPEETRESNYDDRKHPNYEESSTEYAAPTVASETKKSSDAAGGTDCREVQKDSMTCTVCTDPKTGGNFQKCSYAYKPNDKVYKFTNSKTFGYPENQKGSKENGYVSQRAAGSSNYPRESETKQVAEAVKANPCRKVQRDSKTCTVCEDPITGESSEQCAYSYKPKKKHFAYVNSRSFGNPQKEEKGRGDGSTDEGQQESRQVPRYSNEEKSGRSEEKADTADASPCKQVLKDSMTCTVCKDPKTGASSEQCAYSSEPKEKLFTYSKSNSFPKIPQKDGNEQGDRSNSEKGKTDQTVESVETNPCKQVIKDSMTCTICKDPKTGENSEQCAYGSEPKKRHFTYSKSKSFGNPRKRGEEPQESQQISRKLDDDHRDFLSSNKPRGFSKPDWDFHL